MATQALFQKVRLMRRSADDDFVICRNAPYGLVLVLPSQRLVNPAASEDFVLCISER